MKQKDKLDMLYLLVLAIVGTILGFSLGTCTANAASPIRVAVVDSGFDAHRFPHVPLCNSGHRDFTGRNFLGDEIRHGNNITALIHESARQNGPQVYCLILIKVFGPTSTMRAYIAGLQYVETLKVDIINLSLSGTSYSYEEAYSIERLLSNGALIVAAAGNNGWDLNHNCMVYPACLDSRIFVVGNVGKGNVGRVVDTIVDGNRRTAGGLTLSGTSQSTAIATGHVIQALYKKRIGAK